MVDVTVVFKALADPNRRMILQLLKKHDMSAGEVGSKFTVSLPAISKHLSILKAAGLVSETRMGSRIMYHLETENLAVHVGDFMSQICPLEMIQKARQTRRTKKDE